MKKYYTSHLVKGEDLNHHGTLFAARTASWFVESAFIAAACEHGDPGEILCRNIHGMHFGIPVNNGAVVKFVSRVAYAGKTSLTVHVEVTDELSGKLAVEGFLTFVTVSNDTNEKFAHGIRLDEPEDDRERAIREEAQHLRQIMGATPVV